ncbi:MAG: Hsp20/alpha crystallin family protein [Thermoplasmatota archaeon]
MNDCTDYPDSDVTMPCLYINHDLEKYYAQVELPGVRKEDIHLEVMENGFCLKGKRGEKEISGCWMLGHPVDAEKVKAKYDTGLLDIVMPLKNPLTNGKRIEIE